MIPTNIRNMTVTETSTKKTNSTTQTAAVPSPLKIIVLINNPAHTTSTAQR